jgi:hypothetical protein
MMIHSGKSSSTCGPGRRHDRLVARDAGAGEIASTAASPAYRSAFALRSANAMARRNAVAASPKLWIRSALDLAVRPLRELVVMLGSTV